MSDGKFALGRPQLVLSGALILGILLTGVCVRLVTLPPWLGVTLIADNDNQVIVESVSDGGPAAAKLVAGTIIQAANTHTPGQLQLDARTLIEEPDVLPSYRQINDFFTNQTLLSQALAMPTVRLQTDRGEIEIRPDIRPVSSLPLSFWFQILCGLIALLAGCSIWVFQFDSLAARAYALNGLSFMIVTFSAAIYSSRELALDGNLFHVLAAVNHLGAMLFAGTFISLLWVYPNPLGKLSRIQLIIAVFLVIWLLDTLQWLPNTDWGIRIPIIAGLVASTILAALQWRQSDRQPVERASLKWFLFSLFVAGTVFVMAMFVTVMLGLPQPLSQGYAFGIVILMYLGIALGISRYKLFNLERWWFSVWLWFIAGVLIIVIDLLLVYVLQFTQSLALGLTLALSGWFYFPIRQWLMRRLLPGKEKRIDSMFPQLLQIGLTANAPERLKHDWENLLKETFDPLNIHAMDNHIDQAQLVNNGQSMEVPGLDKLPALRLNYPFKGRRLFTPDDSRLCQGLWEMAQRAVSDRRRYEQAVAEERERIHRDLHDDVGAKLLSLTYRGQSIANTDLARSALQDLRDVVSRTSREELTLPQALSEWQSEALSRLEAIGIELRWRQTDNLPDTPLQIQQTMNIGRILREAVSNAIQHGRPKRICIDIGTNNTDVHIAIENDGLEYALDRIGKGRGTKNMKLRSAALGGDIHWSKTGSGCCRVEFTFPLNPSTPAPMIIS